MGMVDRYPSFPLVRSIWMENGAMASKRSYPSGAEKRKKTKIEEERQLKDKETKEDIEEELAKGKRVRISKVKDMTPSPPPTGKVACVASEKAEARTKHTSQKAAAQEAKKKNLLALLNERKAKNELSALCPVPEKKVREHILSDVFSEEDDDDDGGVVPQKLFEEAKEKQRLYQKKYRETSLQLDETKKKLKDLENNREAIEAENKRLRTLNMELQHHLLKRLNASSTTNCSGPIPPTPKDMLQIAESGSEDTTKPTIALDGDEIHLGGGICLRKDIWIKIQGNTKDSLFVKELAVGIWGTKKLGERSLTGKECPTTKTTRQPLTPQHLQTLKACFKEWLQKKNLEEAELQARVGRAGRFITEKIMDVNRQKKKAI